MALLGRNELIKPFQFAGCDEYHYLRFAGITDMKFSKCVQLNESKYILTKVYFASFLRLSMIVKDALLPWQHYS